MAGPTIRLTFAGDATDLNRTMDQVGGAGEKMGKSFSAGSASLVAAGGAAAVGLSSAFTNSLEFDTAQAKLEAQLGNGEYAAEMGAVAGSLYANAYGESLGEVNDALRAVLESGALAEDATNEQIESITGNAMSLAEAFGVDVQGAMSAVAQMMKTGLAPDAATAMDVITRGFQQGVDKSGDFLDTLNEYGVQFQKFGLDGATATALISQGLQAGARDADIVADAIKEFSIRAIDGSKTTADGFAAIGLSADDMRAKIAAGGPEAAAALDLTLDKLRQIEDPAARSAAAVGLFGTQAEDLGAALYALDPSEAVGGLGNVAGAADKVNAALGDTAENKITAVQRGFQDWLNGIVGVQGPMGDLAAGVVGMGTDAVTMAGSVGMAAVAFRGLGIGAGIATAAQWLWNAALSANPLGLVVIAIAALVAGLVWAYGNVGWFRDGVNAAFGAVQAFIGGAADWVRQKWDDTMAWFRSIPGAIGGIFQSAGSAISGAFRTAFNFVADIWNNTVGRISFSIPSWVPVLGGRSFGVPRIPKFHTGGVVPGGPGTEVLAKLQAGERVIPRDRSGSAGGGGTVTFAGNMSDALAVVIMQMIRTGQIQLSF